jgi:2-iminoacetate synthase ThiH
VGRIAYHGSIENVQASWVKIGLGGVHQLLRSGCNDLGGTLMTSNISRAAGASHGQEMTPDRFRVLVAPLGRRLEQRGTTYERVVPRSPSGAEGVPVALG